MRWAGFVLTGGQSSRMGCDKALLPRNGQALVQQVASIVAEAAGHVTLVGRPEAYRHLGLQCISDNRPGFGPLSGLESALATGVAECNLIVACDMPDLHTEFLRSLLETAESTHADCVVTQDSSGRLHPLCAVYRATALPIIERSLNCGRLRLMDLIATLNATPLQSIHPILNCNTSAEWSAFQ